MWYQETETIYDEIEKRKRAMEKLESEINEKQILLDSLTESMIARIKRINMPYSDRELHEAWLVESGQKKEKKPLIWLRNTFIARLFDYEEYEQVEFVGICPEGYEGYNYWFEFIYKGIKFNVQIPNVKLATASNISHMLYGKYSLLYEKTPDFWERIETSYNLEDIKVAIKDFVEKKGE